jgi:hypothetical protein
MKRFFSLILTILILFAGHDEAWAYPEFAGEGYFSCNSCHTSSSGGDLLTAYGRAFAEEKLAMKSFEGEARFGHGAISLPENLLIGGHLRWIQTHYEDGRTREGRFFTMQRDLDIGWTQGPVTSYATVASERKNGYDFDDSTLKLSKWLLRYDMTETFSMRYGVLMPKFGLNLADHNAFVRSRIGLGAGSDEGLAEFSYFSEQLEINLSHTAPVGGDSDYTIYSDDQDRRNFYANVSTFWANQQRVSLSALHRSAKQIKQTSWSLSSVLSFPAAIRFLTEINGWRSTESSVTRESLNLHTQILWRSIQGIYPALVYGQHTESSAASDVRMDKFTAQLSIHPRPHFELSGSFGLRRNLADFTFGHTGYLIFHYWL